MRRFASGVALFVAVSPAAGQSIDRASYYRHVPAMPRIVGQTAASERLHLYGDRSDPWYRDAAPRDGIDDGRARTLHRIAVRFSPILRRNNFSAPRHFESAFEGGPVLHLDRWRGGALVRSDSILFIDRATASASNGESEAVRSDSLLLELVESMHPFRRASRVVRAEGEDELIAFFDFPGADPNSWRRAYQDASDSGIYAHFFIHEDRTIASPARYSFVVQYWFFYPFNDGINNHEGDWEHLAVLITLPERAASDAAGRLTERDVDRILRGEVTEQLVIREVEYYFHESVLTVDYLQPPVPVRTRWQELKHLHIWEQPDYIENVVQERRRALNGRLATHPIGYIGGNNKGPDELTNLWPRFQASYNRNGHGTFPFSGVWQQVGPLGATERLSGRSVPRVRKELEAAVDTLPLDSLFEDDHFLVFDDQEIVLLPDWERVAGLVLEDAAMRRGWSWLLLPIRWGYPATASPGAGAVEHVDVGQVAPEGPAFQPTWNRLAADGGFRQYRPRVLRALFTPMTPWDRLSSGWGFLNIPRSLLGFVPGWSVAMSQLGPWLTVPMEAVGAPPPRTFAPERNPYRFSSVSIGWHRQFGGETFALLLPQPADPELAEHLVEASRLEREPGNLKRTSSDGIRVGLSLHYGPRFAVQNTFARSSSPIAYEILSADSARAGEVSGTLALKEITGGFRYRVRSGFGDVAQLFVGAGWGWTWYDVERVTVRNAPIPFERDGGYPVSILPSARWWPNTWYGGFGLELVPPRNSWLADRIAYGVRIEYTALLHRLGATRPGGGSLGTVGRGELAIAGVLSW